MQSKHSCQLNQLKFGFRPWHVNIAQRLILCCTEKMLISASKLGWWLGMGWPPYYCNTTCNYFVCILVHDMEDKHVSNICVWLCSASTSRRIQNTKWGIKGVKCWGPCLLLILEFMHLKFYATSTIGVWFNNVQFA